jgi:inorganic triphosphatase YgiF
VEVKLRLPDAAAHAKVVALLAASRQAVHDQENYFFDGPGQELGKRWVVLRLRFYNGDEKAVITLKVGGCLVWVYAGWGWGGGGGWGGCG